VTQELGLAAVQESVVDAATIEQLFFDLSQLAQVVEVRIKATKQAYATEAAPTLDAARAALTHGDALGVQLRYRYQGVEWIDTLFAVSGGFRIVRVQAP
jgi:hypothetical protein